MRRIFVTGIGTDVGKTLVSAMLVEALQADYWKPIQTGSFYGTDAEKVKSLVTNEKSQFHPEAYTFEKAMSPHAAAELEGVKIELDAIKIPETTNTLIIEGAGGLMVPLNREHFIIDLIKKYDFEVVLVIQNYLGSINHSLLSIEVMRQHGINVIAKIFNGPRHPLSEDIITHHSTNKFVGYISKENEITKDVILKYADQLKTI